MAADGSTEFSLPENLDKSLVNFEQHLKERLGWSKKKWDSSAEANTMMHKLCNSMTYWVKKLKSAFDKECLIVTLFNYETDVKVSLLELVDGLAQIGKQKELVGFSDFRNPRYVCLHFENEETKVFVEKNLRGIKDNYVVYLDWALNPPLTKVKVHWLTIKTDVNTIKKHLEPYFEFKEQKNESMSLMSGQILKAGKVKFRVKVKEGVNIEQVPHLTYIAGLETLITVQGRLPLCLTCNLVGHIAKVCPTPFCAKCKMLKDRGHVCDNKGLRSYANIVGSGSLAAEFDELEGANVSNFEKDSESSLCSVDPSFSDGNLIENNNISNKGNVVNKTIKVVFKNEVPGAESLPKQSGVNQAEGLLATIAENVSKRWGDESNEEEDRCEDSDVDFSQTEVYNRFDSYIQELNSFRAAPLDKGGGSSVVLQDQTTTLEDETKMDIENKTMKRKLTKNNVDNKNSSLLDSASGGEWTTCYGRGNKGRWRKKESSIFEDKNEKREFVYSD